jgi:hypothetical protein
LAQPALRTQMSANAVRLIRRWDVGECAAGIVNAALLVTGKK